MLGPDSRGAFDYVLGERLDTNPKVVDKSFHYGNHSGSGAPGIHENLGIRAHRQDQGVVSCLPDGGDGGRMVGVA